MDHNSQPMLCSLLSYFQKGDYAGFKKICSLVSKERFSTDPYFNSNLFIASKISGLIEASEKENIWIKSFEGNIDINSLHSKSIGTNSIWFEKNNSIPLIFDWYNKPLILGRLVDATDATQSVYSEIFLKKFPSFVEIEKEILLEEPFPKDWGKYYEIFDSHQFKWLKNDPNSMHDGFLLRSKKDFSSMSYHVIYPNLRLAFRILQPEWAYMIGLHLLKWDSQKIFKISEQQISLVRGFRLPIVLNRFLFSSSKSLRLGPLLEYKNPHPKILNWFAEYVAIQRSINAY